jgi:hypothetical protein
MFYVYFARGYMNEQLIATYRTESGARFRAEKEFIDGIRDIAVFDSDGKLVYEPEIDDEGFLVDEF